MKAFKKLTLEQRIYNLELLIFLAVFSWLLLETLIEKRVSNIWINLTMAAIFGFSFGAWLLKFWMMSLSICDVFGATIQLFCEKHSKGVRFFIKWTSLTGAIVGAKYLFNVSFSYVIGTIVLSVIGNYIYAQFTKKKIN